MKVGQKVREGKTEGRKKIINSNFILLDYLSRYILSFKMHLNGTKATN